MQGGERVNNFQKGMFDKIQQKANINPEDVFKIADSVKHANFSDEKTVRRLVRQLAKLANKPISKDKEDKIVESIVSNKIPSDPDSLKNMFKE